MREIAREFGMPEDAIPPLYVTAHIPSKYAGVYLSNHETKIKIRPEYLTPRTVAHEMGHHLFHYFRPGDCTGEPGTRGYEECEELARMVERWWVAGRPREHGRGLGVHGKQRMIEFTLTRAITLEEAKELARRLQRTEWRDSVDRIGFQGRKLYVVLSRDRADGLIITPVLAAIIAGILGLFGIGVVGWAAGLFAPGPLGLPNIVWVLIAGTALLVSLGWVIGKLMPK